MTKKHTVVVKLRRDRNRPWGIRIAGGADLGTPIIVTRSENEALQKGDVIKKIDDYDSRDVRHVDAQYLLQHSESVKLVVERSEQSCDRPSRSHTPQSSIIDSIYSSDGASSLFSLPKSQPPKILPKSPVPPLVEEYRPYSPEYFNPPHEHLDEVREERFYLSQPYRTTPLVLPGAKVKKDAPLGECYLRHHPNPMIRASPHHYEVANPEVAMKQKVAESVLQRVLGPSEVPKVVHKQFNSPIGLYSEQNIADTIKCQTSAVPIFVDLSFVKHRRDIQEQARLMKEAAAQGSSKNPWPQFNKPIYKGPVKYDPSKSEAYKALQEEAMGDTMQEVKQPARGAVFAPQKANQNRVYHPPQKSPASSYIGGYEDDGEKIHQSGSFKRIMYSVLGQTDY